MPLSLDESLRAIASAQAHAQKIGIRVSVAVVDEGGLLVALSRMDGAMPLSAQIAEAKASGTALTLREGEQMGEVFRNRRILLLSLAHPTVGMTKTIKDCTTSAKRT